MAEHDFIVDNHYLYVEELCRDYKLPLSCLNSEKTEISTNRTEWEYENKSGENFSAPYLESLAVYRKICESLLKYDIVLFHGSALEIGGKAVLFSGPSGAGKSTHARMWRERYGNLVSTINDDKPLLALKPNEIRVYGTPYAGKEKLQTNTSAPLADIVFIKQAPENSIRRLDTKEAYPMLLNQIYRRSDPENIVKTLDLAAKIAQLPIYEVSCTPTHEAAELVYNTIQIQGELK